MPEMHLTDLERIREHRTICGRSERRLSTTDHLVLATCRTCVGIVRHRGYYDPEQRKEVA